MFISNYVLRMNLLENDLFFSEIYAEMLDPSNEKPFGEYTTHPKNILNFWVPLLFFSIGLF